MSAIIQIVFGIQLLAIAVSFYRVWKGPSRADRILMFDLLSVCGISILLTAGILSGSPLFLDVAILVGLISFAGTIGFAYFLEKEKLP